MAFFSKKSQIDHPATIKVFGVLQVVLLVLIVVSLVLFRRRQKQMLREAGARLDGVDIRAAIQRVRVVTPQELRRPGGESTEEANAEPKEAPVAIESALPSWSAQTPAHEILGVAAAADAKTVEAAYRMLLKKYHPDRFASWGKGYQSRAHQVVLQLQKARDGMLSKK